MVLIGIALLIDGVFALRNGSKQLPGSYIKIVYVEMIMMVVFSLVSFTVLMVVLISDQKRLSAIQDAISDGLDKKWVRLVLFITLGVSGFIAGQMLLQIPVSNNPLTSSFLTINRPFFTYIVIVSLVGLLFLAIRIRLFQYLKNQDVKVPILIFLLLLLIIVGIDLSRFGFQKNVLGSGSFRLTGFPILDYQLFLSLLVVVAGSLGFSWMWTKWHRLRDISPILIDILLGLILFVGAFSIWQTAPVIANAFIDQPRPPNFQFYPNLDSIVYDRTALNTSLFDVFGWSTLGKWGRLWLDDFHSIGCFCYLASINILVHKNSP